MTNAAQAIGPVFLPHILGSFCRAVVFAVPNQKLGSVKLGSTMRGTHPRFTRRGSEAASRARRVAAALAILDTGADADVEGEHGLPREER